MRGAVRDIMSLINVSDLVSTFTMRFNVTALRAQILRTEQSMLNGALCFVPTGDTPTSRRLFEVRNPSLLAAAEAVGTVASDVGTSVVSAHATKPHISRASLARSLEGARLGLRTDHYEAASAVGIAPAVP